METKILVGSDNCGPGAWPQCHTFYVLKSHCAYNQHVFLKKLENKIRSIIVGRCHPMDWWRRREGGMLSSRWYIFVMPFKVQRMSQKRGQGRKSRRIVRCAVKRCFLDTTRPLCLWSRCSCGYPCRTSPRSGLLTREAAHQTPPLPERLRIARAGVCVSLSSITTEKLPVVHLITSYTCKCKQPSWA